MELNPATGVESHEQTLERVQAMEGLLQTIKPDEHIAVAESITSTSLDSLSRLYDTTTGTLKTVLAASVFALASNGACAQGQEMIQVDQGMSYEQFKSERQRVNALLGYDVYAEAQKVGRRVTSYIPEKPGTHTIVFIGQVHESENKENNWRLRKSKARSQQEVAQFLQATTTPGAKVFIENFFSSDKEAFDNYRLMATFLSKASSGEQVFDTLARYPALNQGVKNKLAGERLQELGFEETSPFTYQKGTKTFRLPAAGYFPGDKNYKVSSDIESAMTDAALQLQAKARIDLEPAEIGYEGGARKHLAEIVQRMTERAKDLANSLSPLAVDFSQGVDRNSFAVNYKIGIQKSISSQENPADFAATTSEILQKLARTDFCKKDAKCIHLVKQIVDEDIPLLHKVIHDEREDEAVEIIAKHAMSTDQKVFPLVYGSAHSFIQAVKRYEGAIRFNIVTVKSDLDTAENLTKEYLSQE